MTPVLPNELRQPLPARYISLRWRIIFPVILVVMVVCMLAAYFVTRMVIGGADTRDARVLAQSAAAVQREFGSEYLSILSEARRAAETEGLASLLVQDDVEAAAAIMQGLGAAANLDSVAFVDSDGIELVGVLRVMESETLEFMQTSGANLVEEPGVQEVLDGASQSAAVMLTPIGPVVYAIVPDNLGAAMAGVTLERMIDSLQIGEMIDITFYDINGAPIETTFARNLASMSDFAISAERTEAILEADTFTEDLRQVGDQPYRIVYEPVQIGGVTIGILGTMMPDAVPITQAASRQIVALIASGLVAAVVIAVFVLVNPVMNRLDNVTATVESLSSGNVAARTNMHPYDEVGRLGAAIDQMADTAAKRDEQLHEQLQTQRRERNYLLSVIESMPDGIIVQDTDGRVVLVNERARHLLGRDEMLSDDDLSQINRVIGEPSGQALAPGIYSLGDPQNIRFGERVLRAQAAEVVVPDGTKRLGTVIALHDITPDVQQEQGRSELLDRLGTDVHEPLLDSVQRAATEGQPAQAFAQEIARHAAALQKMIVDMRELTKYAPSDARQLQKVISVETLIWAVANDWRQIARAAGLTLNVNIKHEGLFVLGDESRLRWGIGNIVDNAIKYTPTGGTVMLEIHDEVEDFVHLRVRDNGSGISDVDLEHLFVPFYRGTPEATDGTMIRVPGMGQGLPLAQQIIQAHGGQMKVKTRVGVGTAVYIALPLTSGDQMPVAQEENTDHQGETIILQPVDFDDFEAL